MNKVLIANWKMHPDTASEAGELAKKIDFSEVIICPPYPFLTTIKEAVSKAKVGAQDIYWVERGPYVSAVSAAQVASVGASHVVLGHSSRKEYFDETDSRVGKKVGTATRAGLSPILCVGETLEQREAGQTEEVLKTQLSAALAEIYDDFEVPIYIAYEPVWAISVNRTENSPEITPADIEKALTFIKSFVENQFPRVASRSLYLYGGSINERNISEIFSLSTVQGGLVGGASLKPEEFARMVKIRDGLTQ